LKIRGEYNLLKEVKDILDEIKMIKAVLTDQLGVLNDPCLNPEAFMEAKSLLHSIEHTFDLMEAHAKDVESGVSAFTMRYTTLLIFTS
jgi:hypothetical protein